MTAPEAPEWLREILGKHVQPPTYSQRRDGTQRANPDCQCWEWKRDPSIGWGVDQHRAHVAAVIWEATQTRLAEAWDEACQAFAWAMKQEPTSAPVSWLAYVHEHNPYRAADTEET